MMTIAMYVCVVFLIVTVTYLVSALLFARGELLTWYYTLPANRFAFIEKGGELVKIIYNSKEVKLVWDKDCKLGKFVDLSDPRPDLQSLGPVEQLLGIRFVGIPGIHNIKIKEMTWNGVDGSKLVPHNKIVVSNFAISKTFGFNLEGLTIGRDSDKDKSGDKPTGDDQNLERIMVNIRLLAQARIFDPHKAIISLDWVSSVQAKLMRFIQGFLGHTSQDELIEQKAKPGKKYCDLIQELLDNKAELECFGVSFEDEKLTYVDYELTGVDAAKIQEANTTKFTKNKEAEGIKALKIAAQEDMREQKKIMLETVIELTANNKMTMEQALPVALSMMRVKGMTETSLGTLVEGGANVTTAISTGSDKKKKETKTK